MPGARPPYGTQFFHFHIHFCQKVPASGVHAPLMGPHAPLTGPRPPTGNSGSATVCGIFFTEIQFTVYLLFDSLTCLACLQNFGILPNSNIFSVYKKLSTLENRKSGIDAAERITSPSQVIWGADDQVGITISFFFCY